MGIFEDYQKAVLDVEYNNCTLEELEEAEQRLKDSIIDWHPYPEEKPDTDRDCLITTDNFQPGIYGVEVGWLGESGWHSGDELYYDDEVTAWAELPKPYEKGTE